MGAQDDEAREIEHHLTTLPRRLGWLAALLGLAIAVAGIQSGPAAFGLDHANTPLPFVYQYMNTTFAMASVAAVLIRTVRQLRLVIHLHQRASKIDILHLRPAHAFGRLTARTGIGLAIFMGFNFLAEGETITELYVLTLIIIAALAVCVFVLPLLGMRSRLEAEKFKVMSVTNSVIQLTMSRVRERVTSNQYDDIGALNSAMTALVAERNLIAGISTWPWEANSLRAFVSTLLLPAVLLLVSRLAQRLV